MKKLSLILLGLMLLTSAIAQQVVVTFSGKNYLTDEYVQLTRIEIQNKTKVNFGKLTFSETEQTKEPTPIPSADAPARATSQILTDLRQIT